MYQERVDIAVLIREIKQQSLTLSYTAITRELFRDYIDVYRGMESDQTLCRVARGYQRVEFGASQYYGREENGKAIMNALHRLSDYVSSWEVVADNVLELLQIDEEVTANAMTRLKDERKKDTMAFLVTCIQFAVKRPFYRRDRTTGQSTYYTKDVCLEHTE